MEIQVFTDGSATTAEHPGGWAYVLVVDGKKYSEGSGYLKSATNNDAELEAAIQGLTAANTWLSDIPYKVLSNSPESFSVTLCSDSEIILGWADGSYKFKQESKVDKYRQLQYLVTNLSVTTQWVKGHSGNEHNERCDKLANLARKKLNIPNDMPVQNKGDSAIGDKKNGVVSLWYKGILRIVDFEAGIVETYSRDVHGKRGSVIEIRESKER